VVEVILGVGAFSAAFLIHGGIWRIRVPESAPPVFAVLFGATYVAACAAYALLVEPATVAGFLYWSLLYAALTAAYMLAYVMVAYDSPGLAIVRRLAEGGQDGVSEADLHAFIRARPFVENRLEQFYRDGFAVLRNGRIELADRSVRLLRIFELMRAVLGSKPGSG
jgi:hypothetical protein